MNMKKAKYILLAFLLLIAIIVWFNYPKLNIMSGYSAKSMASSVFVAERGSEFTDETDNNFSPINIAEDKVDIEKKSASASVYGFKTRTAIYRDGLGSVLIPEDVNYKPVNLIPQRHGLNSIFTLPFPYGKAEQKDTIFDNVDYKLLNTTVEKYTKTDKKTRALLVVYKDQIIAEFYADGFSKSSKLLGWSMTKSLVSTMYGILQSQEKIDLEAKAPIEAWQNDERKEITLKNLLEMNSGLEWEEDYATISDVTKMLFLAPDMTSVQIEKPLIGKPNETWYYSSGTTNLLSGILRRQFRSHQAYLDFPYSNLIDKIGMHSMLIETDYDGNFVGSSYGWATARDWAKFGLLYLHQGNWNGEQIFNKNWYNYAITPTNTSKGRYGAQIWLNRGRALPDVPEDMFSFNGFQGQRVFILPSNDLVVVRLGLEELDFNDFLSDLLLTIK